MSEISYVVHEYTIEISLRKPVISKKDLDKIQCAWSNAGYHIYLEIDDTNIWISSTRSIRQYAGIDISQQWRNVREQLEAGKLPDEIVEKALQHYKKNEK